jgi:LacI family transcriptional regulator
MLNGLTEAARDRGYMLSLFVTSHNKEEAIQAMNKVITSHVDGAIIFDDELDVEDTQKISSYQVPVIAVNNKITSDKVGCITFGYEHLLRDILNSYFTSGEKKMYFLHVHNAGRLLARIERSFVTTHIDANKSYGILSCDDSYTKTYLDFIEFFKTTKSGYFLAYRDSLAAAIINAARDSGLRIPEDVEVLSIIGTKYANIIRPTISSMYIDMQLVGRKAMQMLSDLMAGKLSQKQIKVESTFIKRDTTKE